MTETTEMIIVGNRLRHRSLARSIVLKKHRKNKKPQVKIRLQRRVNPWAIYFITHECRALEENNLFISGHATKNVRTELNVRPSLHEGLVIACISIHQESLFLPQVRIASKGQNGTLLCVFNICRCLVLVFICLFISVVSFHFKRPLTIVPFLIPKALYKIRHKRLE